MVGSPHVTITIPVYNGAEHIGRAVASALAQDYEHLTVLVVDNCSTDETVQILCQFDDPRLVVKRFDEFLPLAANWDRALQAAEGDLVLVMSADNEMLPGAVSALVASLEAEPSCGMAIGRVIVEVAPGHRRLPLEPVSDLPSGVIDDLERYLLRRGYNFSINAVLFRRNLPGLRFDPATRHGCDVDLLLRLGQVGVKAVAIENPIHYWLDHPDTTTFKKYDAVWEDILRAYVNASPAPELRGAYRERIGRTLFWECMLLLRRGLPELARQRVEQYGSKTSWVWRLLIGVMLTVPGAHAVPGAVRWLRTRLAARLAVGESRRAVGEPRAIGSSQD